MQTDLSERLSASLETLSARIARLAIGLGVDLSDPTAIQKLMEQPRRVPVSVERRVTTSDSRVLHATSCGERRVSHLHEELRGLVTLRYHIETVSVAENGLAATRQILARAHQHLIDQGFKAGADGLNVQALLGLSEPLGKTSDHECPN